MFNKESATLKFKLNLHIYYNEAFLFSFQNRARHIIIIFTTLTQECQQRRQKTRHASADAINTHKC